MQQTEASLMEVQGLSKFFYVGGGGPFGLGGERRYVHAVEDVSFTLRRGYILALVGESGSGKSTIARLLARLYPPTSGQVRLKGRDVLSQHGHRAMLAYRAEVQMIFQDPFGWCRRQTLSTSTRTSYRVGSDNASPSRARWRSIPRSFSPMSR